eukprot:763025-Hanusia_phi.AAC.3
MSQAYDTRSSATIFHCLPISQLVISCIILLLQLTVHFCTSEHLSGPSLEVRRHAKLVDNLRDLLASSAQTPLTSSTHPAR